MSSGPPPPAQAQPRGSLRSRIVRHVAVPLALTWTLGTSLALGLASYFVAEAYDRSLLDDAYAVAAHVRNERGQLTIDLTASEMGTLLFDQSESVYFAVRDLDGKLVSGHGALWASTLPDDANHRFGYSHLHGRDVRTVTLRRSPQSAFVVVIAQTTESRNRLLNRLLAVSVVPQLLLLALLAAWLLRSIGKDLRPLGQLHMALNRRDANDLSPLPASVTSQARSQEVERLGTAINSLLARLEQSLDAQRDFSGNVAHELRTPLAGIRAQAEYALAQADPEVWRTQLQGILRSEARASHQVDQLLALARADEAHAALELRPIQLDELVRDVVLRYLPRADAAGVDLGAVGLDEPTEVRADAALVEGLLGNLLDNALRYGSALHPAITVALNRTLDSVTLTVTDNGPGLNEEDRVRLTQRGLQGPAGQRLGVGAGLGLSIVRRYAELLGADFRLGQNPDGAGLSASVQFPLAARDGAPLKTPYAA